MPLRAFDFSQDNRQNTRTRSNWIATIESISFKEPNRLLKHEYVRYYVDILEIIETTLYSKFDGFVVLNRIRYNGLYLLPQLVL